MIENDCKRERSALYPMITVDACFEIIELIDKIGGKLYSTKAIADAVGMSEKTNSFRARISTLRQYGLISGSQGAYQLTDISNDYLYPTHDEQKKDAKLRAFLNVPLYKKLVEKYENQALPSPDKLANTLLGKDYGLTKSTKDLAVDNFISSLEQLGLLINGILLLKQSGDQTEDVTLKKTEENNQEDIICNKSETESYSSDKCYQFEIPALNGEAAVVRIPRNITNKDLDFIKMYIENMLPTFLDNLRTED